MAKALSVITAIVKGGESKQVIENEKLVKAIIKQFNKMA
jgi:predicted nucleotidyltransferase